MLCSISLGLCSLLYAVAAGPVRRDAYVSHEKRELMPSGWTPTERTFKDAMIEMRFGLTQTNLDRVEQILMEVSHPDSERYGQHYSADEVTELFAPSDATVDIVKSWLADSGIAAHRIKQSVSKGWLSLEASILEAEALLKTEYWNYQHESGSSHLACNEYFVPAHVSEHIDFITPTLHFDVPVGRGQSAKYVEEQAPVEKRQLLDGLGNIIGDTISEVGHIIQDIGNLLGADRSLSPINPVFVPLSGLAAVSGPVAASDLTQCYRYTTPACLQALYKVPVNSASAVQSSNSFGIVEYSPQAYRQADLNLFFKSYAPSIAQGTAPTLDDIDYSGLPQTSTVSFQDNGESDLDLEYAMALVYPQKVTLFQVGDNVQSGSFNTFLDGIDRAYCTSGGGDDPTQDPSYPDAQQGGYKGSQDCGKYSGTKVISTSYGYNEADLTAKYETRQCNEYAKLGLMGISFLFSSGDYGVAGNNGQCIASDGTYNSGKSGRFNPAFPSTCPYVTSVGATQVKPNTSPSATNPEMACETVIYSGGGFSNVFQMPSYQQSAVSSYFANHKPAYTAAQYNNSQTTRGYPDISANGANYVVAVDGNFSMVYGTSASAPTAGSIFTLVNQKRLANGKSSLGFLNPTLYSNPSLFTDITSGGNQGCGTAGFTAVSGWDPVTGLGTPDYNKLVAALT